MIDAILAQNAHFLDLLDTLSAPLTDDHRINGPSGGGKSPAWLLGHLAVTADGGRTMCGLPRRCPREWWHLFGPGTTPAANASAYPPIATLRAEALAINAELREAFPRLPREVLETANPYPPTAAPFPTIGDFLCYMLAGHLGYHVGQLTLACRSNASE